MGRHLKLEPPPASTVEATDQTFDSRIDRALENALGAAEAALAAVKQATAVGALTPAILRETASVSRAVATISAEHRARSKHAQSAFEAMSLEERNALLLNHLDELDASWLDKFEDRINEIRGAGSVLGGGR